MRHVNLTQGSLLILCLLASQLMAQQAEPLLARKQQSEVAETAAIRVMSLNIFGYATMPQSAADYARLINARNIDVLAVQEGVQDWQIGTSLPTDYSRAGALHQAMGTCWQRHYQILLNRCKGWRFVSSRRFDLTDGPNAMRTGESAVVAKTGAQFAVVNVHWDHQSDESKIANAAETADEVNTYADIPLVLLGDFNTACSGVQAASMRQAGALKLIVDAGIDCIFVRGLSGQGTEFDAAPSDHPGIDATLFVSH